MSRAALAALALVLAAGCGLPAARYPSDVQAALAGADMRRMETAQLVLYYPEGRAALAARMAARIEACATTLRAQARLDNRHSREKMVLVVPDAPFNNAYVLPPVGGLEDVSVVPAGSTLDFATAFGLPPDPGLIGCHEIVHYVQMKQIAGLWGGLRTVFGDLLSPQVGFDAWFLEGLATYYEARLSPGAGRPRWPVFTSMFHAAYAGGELGQGDLSEQKRRTPVGHHYLVGTMFVRYLAETYGEAPLWRLIELQARSKTVLFGLNGTFAEVYGRGLGDLFEEFRRWVAVTYPVRARPAAQRVVQRLGDDARWAWGPAGEVAVIDADADAPARLRVWGADGALLASEALVDVLPPRRQVIGAPLFVSGMSFAADGTLWFTSLDLGGTYQTTRLYRWRRGAGLARVTSGLGPGGAIAPDGATYYHMAVDGDRWSLAAHPLGGGPGRVVWDAKPGQYALRVAPSPDGTRLALSVWDGQRFAVWVLEAATGARRAVHDAGSGPADGGARPLYDAAWTPDGRLLLLDEVDGRFQVALATDDGRRTIVSDAPYGALEPRAHAGAIRFLARDGWQVTLDEIALPPPAPLPAPAAPDPPAPRIDEPPPATGAIVSDAPYSRLDGLLAPSLHALTFQVPPDAPLQLGLAVGGGDRLDLLRWSVAGFVDVETGDVSGIGGVLWNDLAPWQVSVTGSRTIYTSDVMGVRTEHETREADASIGRVWRGTYLAAAGGGYVADREDEAIVRLFGPRLSLGYGAAEGTRISGPRRGLGLALDGAYYPRGSGPVIDARAQLDLYVPVPATRRHVVRATARWHTVDGASEPLLQVGGWSPTLPLYAAPDDTPELSPGERDALPDGVTFAEPVRGFEDLGFDTSRAAIGDVAWTYPVVIDRGVTSVLFLPATFLSQLDLEVFAAAALLEPEPTMEDFHAAAGAAVGLRLSLFRVPLLLRYQGARRLTDDQAWTQLLGLGIGM